MGDLSKREDRHRRIIEAMERARPAPGWKPPNCHCGAPATYEVNRGVGGVTFVCAKHLPLDL